MLRRGFHDTVRDFKRLLLEVTLAEHAGNRSRTAVTLGLERTYLLRLIKQFKVKCPQGQIGGQHKKKRK
jgi:DNA-binding NtrC family response regulator